MDIETLITLQNQILKIGVRVSILLVLIAGGMYLYSHGLQPHAVPNAIVENPSITLELKIVEYGFYTLILIQFMRLFFVCTIFLLKKNFLFLLMSLFVFGFILFAMFAPFFDIKLFEKIS